MTMNHDSIGLLVRGIVSDCSIKEITVKVSLQTCHGQSPGVFSPLMPAQKYY